MVLLSILHGPPAWGEKDQQGVFQFMGYIFLDRLCHSAAKKLLTIDGGFLPKSSIHRQQAKLRVVRHLVSIRATMEGKTSKLKKII